MSMHACGDGWRLEVGGSIVKIVDAVSTRVFSDWRILF
jgi:hypothetical protein